MDRYDMIVIGAGNSGLVAAAAASREGYRTLLLEGNNLPGGSATSFRRGRFEFEPSLHELAQVGTEEQDGQVRQLFRRLGAEEKFYHVNHTYRVISTDPEEPFDASMPCGIENFIDEMERQVPGCRESVKRFFDYGMESVKVLRGLGDGSVKPMDLVFRHKDFMRMNSHSAEECMDLFGIPKKAQHIMTAYWPYVGEPTDTLSAMTMAMMLIVYVVYGAGVPEGFSHGLSLAMEKAARDHGCDIWYNALVDKVLIREGRVYGVEVNGRTIYSDHIISSSFPNHVFGHMVNKKEIPELEVRKANARDLGLSFVTAYLGLNRSAEELGIRDYSIFLLPYASPREQYEHCFGLEGEGWTIVNCLNMVVPDCTPKGTCQLFFTRSVYGDAWGSVKPEDYRKTKLRIAREMIEYYEKAVGIQVRPFIEEIEVATPVTFSRYLHTPNGTPYGYQVRNWDSMLQRTMNLEKERTIKGLRFCGAHSEKLDGYSSAFFSGEDTAKKTIEDIKEGR